MAAVFVFMVILGMSVRPALGQLTSFTFDGEVQTPASVAPNLGSSSFGLSSGSVTFPGGNAPSPGDSISAGGWNGPEGTKWWEFTVTPDPGNVLNLSYLAFDDQRSSTGPAIWSLSINGAPAATGQATHAAFGGNPMNVIDLSGEAFQGLGSAVVSLYGAGAASASGTWRIDNVALHGTVSAVPEPHAYALIFAAGLLGFAGYRRRQLAAAK